MMGVGTRNSAHLTLGTKFKSRPDRVNGQTGSGDHGGGTAQPQGDKG